MLHLVDACFMHGDIARRVGMIHHLAEGKCAGVVHRSLIAARGSDYLRMRGIDREVELELAIRAFLTDVPDGVPAGAWKPDR